VGYAAFVPDDPRAATASTKEACVNTAQLVRPAPAATDLASPTAVVQRLRHLRRSTPGRLQLIMVALIAIGLAAGATAGLAANSAATGTRDLGNRIQPLLIEAETIYTALADADATAAQAFLAGGLEPVGLTERYDADLSRASTALASAARRTPAGGPTATAVDTLAAGISEYAGLVATARANNRQGLPVGASYLSVASTLNRDGLQPQARTLFRTAQDELDDGYANARSTIWLSLLTLLLLALLGALVLAQRYLSRTTRRTFNVPLVAATVVAALLTLGTGGLFAAQHTNLSTARSDGSDPIVGLATLRLDVLQERSDEALTLAARGAEPKYEADFGAVSTRITRADDGFAEVATAVDGPVRAAVQAASQRHQDYLAAHARIRALDNEGRYDDAVELAVGPQTTATFTALTGQLGIAVEAKKVTFTDEITAAGRGLDLLSALGPVLALVICALAVAGIRARLEEYR
jgi:hypothetical protein